MKLIYKQHICVLLACTLLLFGCPSRDKNTESESAPSFLESDISTVQSSSMPSFANELPPPESELSLYDWWKDYLYDAVAVLDGDYPSLMQLDTEKMINYCGIRMQRDGLVEPTEIDIPANLSKNDLTKYTQRYFNKKLSELDIVNRDAENTQYISQTLSKTNTPDESLQNGIFTLKKAETQPDQTVLLTVEKALEEGVQKLFFTMAPHKNGQGWYFARVEQQRGDLPSSIKLSGSYRSAHKLLHQTADLLKTQALGEVDGKLLFSDSPENSGYLLLSLVNSDTMEEQFFELKLSKGESFLSARAKNERIVIVTTQRILSMDGKFADQRSMDIPASLKAAAGGNVPDFDLSADRKKAVFSSEKGLMLYDFGSGSVKLLAEYPQTAQLEGLEESETQENANTNGSGMNSGVFGKPVFYDNDSKVQASIKNGMYLYDLQTEEGKLYDQAYAWIAYAAIIGNRAVGFDLPKEESIVPHVWMDLVTEELHALDLPSEYTQVQLAPTARGLSLLAMSSDANWQLFSLNMETMQLEKQDFSISGIDPIVYGAAENGKVLLGFFDESQQTGQILLAG